MKPRSRLVVILSVVVFLAISVAPLSFTRADETAPTYRQLRAMKEDLKTQQDEFEEFSDLVETLDVYRNDSGNSGRRVTIDDLHAAMRREILQLEEKYGENHTIIRHGQDSRKNREDDEDKDDPVYLEEAMETAMKTGGMAGNSELDRLTRMQEIYIFCKRFKLEAVNGVERAFDRYYNSVLEFAGLMNIEVQALRSQIEGATSPASMLE